MRFKLIELIIAFLILSIVGCESKKQSIVIELGMDIDDVRKILIEQGAKDISNGMQVSSLDGSDPRKNGPLSGFMWHLDDPNITIETKSQNGKLSILNVWDWSGQKRNSYYHMLTYDEVSRLQIGPGSSYQTTVLRTHNAK